MKVHVGDNLFIESDELQFIIRKYSGKNDKNDRPIYTNLGYFSSLSAAIQRLVKIKVMESEATTIGELLTDLERIEREINEMIRV